MGKRLTDSSGEEVSLVQVLFERVSGTIVKVLNEAWNEFLSFARSVEWKSPWGLHECSFFTKSHYLFIIIVVVVVVVCRCMVPLSIYGKPQQYIL